MRPQGIDFFVLGECSKNPVPSRVGVRIGINKVAEFRFVGELVRDGGLGEIGENAPVIECRWRQSAYAVSQCHCFIVGNRIVKEVHVRENAFEGEEHPKAGRIGKPEKFLSKLPFQIDPLRGDQVFGIFVVESK